MNLANVPTWAWGLLAIGGTLFAQRNGWLDAILKKATDGKPGPTLLPGLEGYRTKLAAIALAVLAGNEMWHFLPDQYVNGALYLSGSAGLYFLREAVDRLKTKL